MAFQFKIIKRGKILSRILPRIELIWQLSQCINRSYKVEAQSKLACHLLIVLIIVKLNHLEMDLILMPILVALKTIKL